MGGEVCDTCTPVSARGRREGSESAARAKWGRPHTALQTRHEDDSLTGKHAPQKQLWYDRMSVSVPVRVRGRGQGPWRDVGKTDSLGCHTPP